MGRIWRRKGRLLCSAASTAACHGDTPCRVSLDSRWEGSPPAFRTCPGHLASRDADERWPPAHARPCRGRNHDSREAGAHCRRHRFPRSRHPADDRSHPGDIRHGWPDFGPPAIGRRQGQEATAASHSCKGWRDHCPPVARISAWRAGPRLASTCSQSTATHQCRPERGRRISSPGVRSRGVIHLAVSS